MIEFNWGAGYWGTGVSAETVTMPGYWVGGVSGGYFGHRNGMNVLYCDYHMAWQPATAAGLRVMCPAQELYDHWFPDL
ncbi:MAG: hypothetical protein HY360_12625 [Verrucomicrobia bacterium]|nr:hypothetical protein [Verrucomicrobiota bacterium]